MASNILVYNTSFCSRLQSSYEKLMSLYLCLPVRLTDCHEFLYVTLLDSEKRLDVEGKGKGKMPPCTGTEVKLKCSLVQALR